VDLRRLTKDEADILIARLEDEHERMKEKLLYQELIVQRTKDEVDRKKEQIKKIREETHRFYLQPRTHHSILAELAEELDRAGIKRSDKVFGLLDEISKMLNSERH